MPHDKVTAALKRLKQILPLKKNQLSLSEELNALYQFILSSYINTGRSLTREEMKQYIDDVAHAVKILKDKDLVVFDDNDEPIGAYPFTMEPRVNKISVNGFKLNSMCALDSLAISPMYNKVVEITSRCHVTDVSIFIKQDGVKILNTNAVEELYFGINWGSESATCCCANSLCGEMVFLKGNRVMSDWLNEDIENRETFSLKEAIDFSAKFFVPITQS